MSRIIIGALVGILVLSACDIKKRADHLRDSTDQMKEKTNEIAEVSEGMKGRMDQMKTQVSHGTFEEYISLIFGENMKPGDLEANNEPRMIYYATSAVNSMEFQVWQGPPHHTVEQLDEDYARSVRAFFVRITQYIDRSGFELNVWNPTRSYKGVGALGTALAEVNPEFKARAKAVGLGDASFYAMIVKALELRNGEVIDHPLKKTIQAVLEWKQEAIHILQMRHIYNPMKVVTRMTDLQDRGTFGRLSMMLGGLDVDLSRFDDEQFKIWSFWLDEAIETRQTLRDLGYEPKFNQMLLNIQKSLAFKNVDPSGLTEAQKSNRTLVVDQFLQKFSAIHTVAEPGLRTSQNSQEEVAKN